MLDAKFYMFCRYNVMMSTMECRINSKENNDKKPCVRYLLPCNNTS